MICQGTGKALVGGRCPKCGAIVIGHSAEIASIHDAPLDRVKAAAQEHGPLSAPDGFAALLGCDLTPAERAQLRGRR